VKESKGLVIFGKNAVEEAVKSGKRIEKIYLLYGKFYEPSFLSLLEEKKIRFQWAKKRQLEKLAKSSKHQGVVAILSPIEYAPLEELLTETAEKNSFFVALDGISEPQNLGVIARVVESFGGVGLLLEEKGSAPINEVAVKSSSGAIFHLKVSRVPSLSQALKKFKELGGRLYSLETGGEDIRKATFSFPLALILGSEGRGVREELLKLSEKVLTIPTTGKTPSLNVSTSCAIGVWEIFKRKN